MSVLKGRTARQRSKAAIVGALALLLHSRAADHGGGAIARHTAQATVPLGNAASFGALSAAAMTNTGLDTVVNGDVGSSTSIDVGVTHPGFSAYGAGSSQLANAQASLLTAYGNAEAQTPTGDITGVNLAGQVVTPGVYNSTGGILISGPVPLTLDGGGNADSVFIFQAAVRRRPDRRSDVQHPVHERRSAVQRLLEGPVRVPEEHRLHLHRHDSRADSDHADGQHHRRREESSPAMPIRPSSMTSSTFRQRASRRRASTLRQRRRRPPRRPPRSSAQAAAARPRQRQPPQPQQQLQPQPRPPHSSQPLRRRRQQPLQRQRLLRPRPRPKLPI